MNPQEFPLTTSLVHEISLISPVVNGRVRGERSRCMLRVELVLDYLWTLAPDGATNSQSADRLGVTSICWSSDFVAM